MDLQFRIRDSAKKHGLKEEDIRRAFETCCYIDLYENRPNVFILLGFDRNANPVEILYNEFGGNGINVFHAMPCRKQYYHHFDREGLYD